MDNLKKKYYTVFLKICYIICIISYITNFGWMRILYFFHFIAHFAISRSVNKLSIKYMTSTNKLDIFIIINGIVMILGNISLPDVGDAPGDSFHMFFGMIKDPNNILASLSLIWPYVLILHILIILLQFIYIKRIEFENAKNNSSPE